jgi:hypothetical protein
MTAAAAWFAKLDHEDPHIRFCPVIFSFLAGISWGALLSRVFW